MAIIDDFDGIAKRLRELQSAAPQDFSEVTDLEEWRGRAQETARRYVDDRRRDAIGGANLGKPIRHTPRS